MRAFIDFYLTNASHLVKEVGYVPLQPQVYRLAKTRFARRVTGSVFGEGGSQVGVRLEELLKRQTRAPR